MEDNGASSFRHGKSSSSDRFIARFTQSQPDNVSGDKTVTNVDDELNEDDVFWTGDFSESNPRLNPSPTKTNRDHHSRAFHRPENFGILAALPENSKNRTLGDRTLLNRRSSISSSSSSRMIPSIPKPKPQRFQGSRDYSLSLPSVEFHRSAPVNVPVLSKAVVDEKRRNLTVCDVADDDDDDDDGEGEGEMLPPHEIVAMRPGGSPKTTFSVLEGVGRTLKGRDLRRVRNAVWRKTGFLD